MTTTVGRKHDREGILNALLACQGRIKNVEIAKRFGCTPMTVSDVKHQNAHLFPEDAFRRPRGETQVPLVPLAYNAPRGTTHQTEFGFFKVKNNRVFRWAGDEWVISTLAMSELRRADHDFNKGKVSK